MNAGILRATAAALGGVLWFIAAQPLYAQPTPPAIPKIADLRTTDLRLGGSAEASLYRPLEIHTPDASFIKPHFDYFALPEGVTLEVSSPDGREVHRYGKTIRDGHTVDAALGQDGVTSFSSLSISGPVAVLRLVGTPREPWGPQHGVTITRYLEGYPEDLLPELRSEGLLMPGATPKSICGVDDKRAAACYASDDPAAFDRSRPVAMIVTGGGGLCTSWRVSPDNRMFTNNHCLDSTADVAASEFWFNHQLQSCDGSAATPTKVTGNTMLATGGTLDYTLFTVNDFASISGFGYLGLDVRQPTLNEEIFIAGHPGARRKELSVVSDQDGGGHCRVNDPNHDGNGADTDAGYYCDTEGGSSGSPVIARASRRAIALHHFGGCLNSGAKFSLIWPQVSSHFGDVIPPGDDEGGNLPPVADFSFTVSGLIASFTDASSDSDGSIVARSWNFGDGSTSSATNPSHTYAAAGTYNVSLTVTDDDGATHTTTKPVSVGGGFFENTTDVAIVDNRTVVSRIAVSGVPGNAPSNLQVTVNIEHTYIGDLRVVLASPDGTRYVLHNRAGGSADDLHETYTVDASSEVANGEWRLRVNDNAAQDVGKIDSWSLQF